MPRKKPVEKLYSINSHRVQVLMAERKYRLRHLAERLDVTVGHVAHIITNRRVSKVLRPRLAALLGVSLDAILDKSKVVKLKPKGRPVSVRPSTGPAASSSRALAATAKE